MSILALFLMSCEKREWKRLRCCCGKNVSLVSLSQIVRTRGDCLKYTMPQYELRLYRWWCVIKHKYIRTEKKREKTHETQADILRNVCMLFFLSLFFSSHSTVLFCNTQGSNRREQQWYSTVYISHTTALIQRTSNGLRNFIIFRLVLFRCFLLVLLLMLACLCACKTGCCYIIAKINYGNSICCCL